MRVYKFYRYCFILVILLISSSRSFAVSNVESDKDMFCASKPYDVSSSFGQSISKISGMNFLLTQLGETAFERELKKFTSGSSKFDVKIIPYSSKNLLEGKFKSFEIYSPTFAVNGISLSQFKAKTYCDYNYITSKNGRLKFKENFVLDFEGKITQNDLKKILDSKNYKKLIDEINFYNGDSILFKMLDPDIKIEDNKLNITLNALIPFFGNNLVKRIKTQSDLEARDGKIVMSNIKFNDHLNFDPDILLPILNRFNPLTYQIKLDKDINAIIKMSNVKIENNEILLNGYLVILKS